jgi:hypothetical protein
MRRIVAFTGDCRTGSRGRERSAQARLGRAASARARWRRLDCATAGCTTTQCALRPVPANNSRRSQIRPPRGALPFGPGPVVRQDRLHQPRDHAGAGSAVAHAAPGHRVRRRATVAAGLVVGHGATHGGGGTYCTTTVAPISSRASAARKFAAVRSMAPPTKRQRVRRPVRPTIVQMR